MIIDVVLVDKEGYIDIVKTGCNFLPFGKDVTLGSGLLGKYKGKIIAIERSFDNSKISFMNIMFDEMSDNKALNEKFEINWLYWKDVKTDLLK